MLQPERTSFFSKIGNKAILTFPNSTIPSFCQFVSYLYHQENNKID